jgi:hypothetical protein
MEGHLNVIAPTPLLVCLGLFFAAIIAASILARIGTNAVRYRQTALTVLAKLPDQWWYGLDIVAESGGILNSDIFSETMEHLIRQGLVDWKTEDVPGRSPYSSKPPFPSFKYKITDAGLQVVNEGMHSVC